MESPLLHHLTPHFSSLAQRSSMRDLEKDPLYRKLLPEIQRVLSTCEAGEFASPTSAKIKTKFRALNWNLERGICLDGILEVLKTHPELKNIDIFLAPETDLGMARSANRNVAREIAKHLGFNYVFAPCYLNLEKGSGMEAEVEEENHLGLHGNAIFSRYPMKDFHLISLKNNKDKMRGKEKRLGNQQVAVVTVCLPGQDLRVVCAHLDAHSSKRHRRDQMRTILDGLRALPELPTLLGGDFNTMTYNSRHAVFAIYGFWVRVAMGVRRMIKYHYPYPDRLFERALFKSLEREGFDYKSFNELGVCTLHYHVEDLRKIKNLKDWIPNWCFQFIEWALRENQGRCSFKLDWLAGKGIQAVPGTAKVVGGVKYQGGEVSDHDPIVAEFKLGDF